jgi:hypothetical protein
MPMYRNPMLLTLHIHGSGTSLEAYGRHLAESRVERGATSRGPDVGFSRAQLLVHR